MGLFLGRLLVKLGIFPVVYGMRKWDYCVVTESPHVLGARNLYLTRQVEYDPWRDITTWESKTIFEFSRKYYWWLHYIERKMLIDESLSGEGFTMYYKPCAGRIKTPYDE